MKIEASVELNLKIKEVTQAVEKATREAMRDTVVEVTHDTIHGSPKKTGHNMRSIAGEVSGMGVVNSGGEGGAERMVDDSKIEGTVYGTSGYSGYLEVGTVRMAARSYFRPALDRNFSADKFAIRIKEYLKS